jgi:3-oxoacyl-[acyl-carrier protein] reductase
VVAAREGADVAFTFHSNEEGAEQTAAAITAYGRNALPIHADLSDAAAADAVIQEIESQWEGIDVLVNNAGVSESIPFVLISDDELMDLMQLNFFAAFRLCRASARGMIRRKYGRIVNISSIAGSRSIAGPPHYAASKGALDGLTRSLGHELGPYNILVNSIVAGIFDGGLRASIPEHHQKRYLESCAAGRFGTPEECGELVAWLGSERNTYTNGALVHTDGATLA